MECTLCGTLVEHPQYYLLKVMTRSSFSSSLFLQIKLCRYPLGQSQHSQERWMTCHKTELSDLEVEGSVPFWIALPSSQRHQHDEYCIVPGNWTFWCTHTHCRSLDVNPGTPQLVMHSSYWNVALVECCAELIAQHLVIVLNSSGIRGPPSTCGPTKLLHCKQDLLELRAMKKSELELSHTKTVVSFKQVFHLGELWRVCCQEVEVGGLLRLLTLLRTSLLTLINVWQSLHDGILRSQ
jgi:hypothetical protein